MLAAVLAAVGAGFLAYLAGSPPADAVLAGGAALGAAITLLNALIG